MQVNTISGVVDRVGIWAQDARDEFRLAYNKPVSPRAEAAFNRIVQTVDGTQITERFAGLKAIGELVAANGEISFSGLDNFGTTCVASEFGRGLAWRMKDMIADEKNLALLSEGVSLLAVQAQKKKYELFKDVLEDNVTWEVDSQALFADSHEFGDNNITVAGLSSATRPTEADLEKVIDACREQIGTYTTDHGTGNPLVESVESQFMQFVGPAKYHGSFRRLQRRENIAVSSAGVTNIEQNTFDYWAFPRLTQANNIVFVFFVDPSDDGGNPNGSGSILIRNEFIPYDLEYAGPGDGSDQYVTQRKIMTSTYGMEGIAPANAVRCIKATLTT